MNSSQSQLERKIWRVSDLTRAIKNLLESAYAFIWVTGEVSDFRMPVSGHCYLTLKDATSRISAVMFKGQYRNLKFSIENGLKVLGFGRVSVYEPKGTYQIILEYLEPAGLGSQLLALEQLKRRLSEEGIFSQEIKKPIPHLPENICLITSPTGAAVHDFLKVMKRRFANMSVDIIPVRVQGQGAGSEIATAIEWMNRIGRAQVGILTRGGGSSEDLSAFNSEALARAIFASKIPIVSAIGHEIDFTIADLAADLRAATPSAAAELVIPEKRKLHEKRSHLTDLLTKTMETRLLASRRQWAATTNRLKDPTRKVQEWRLRLDDLQSRMLHFSQAAPRIQRERLQWRVQSLWGLSPMKAIFELEVKHEDIRNRLSKSTAALILQKKRLIEDRKRILSSLGPLNILSRGYSITRRIADGRILTRAESVTAAESIEVVLHKGRLEAEVTKVVD